MQVSSLMSTPAITVSASTPLRDAALLMLDKHVGGLPVVDGNGVLVGIITESDFLRRGEIGSEKTRSRWLSFFTSPGKMAEEYVLAHGRKVEEVMTRTVRTVSSSATSAEAAAIMEKHGVKRLPVVDEGRIVGILSRTDFMRAMANAPSLSAKEVSDDARMELAIMKEIAGQAWSRNTYIRVCVRSGVAELSGTIFDDREREAACVAAENVSGVKAVVDRLSWIEPNSGILITA